MNAHRPRPIAAENAIDMRAEGALVPGGGRTIGLWNCPLRRARNKGSREPVNAVLTVHLVPPPPQHESCGVLASLVGELEGESTQAESQGLEGR